VIAESDAKDHECCKSACWSTIQQLSIYNNMHTRNLALTKNNATKCKVKRSSAIDAYRKTLTNHLENMYLHDNEVVGNEESYQKILLPTIE